MWLGKWMTSCPEAMGWDCWVFWKKQLVEIWDWTKRVGIRIWARPVQLFTAGCAHVCWVSELWADAGRTVSIVKFVSLSPRVENLKVKKVIKVSYLNQESRQCFGIPMPINVLTYPYICIVVSWLFSITKTIQVRRTRCRTLLEKQGRTHKRCTLMDPHTWPCKSRTTSTNIHSAAMWGYGMLSWRPT